MSACKQLVSRIATPTPTPAPRAVISPFSSRLQWRRRETWPHPVSESSCGASGARGCSALSSAPVAQSPGWPHLPTSQGPWGLDLPPAPRFTRHSTVIPTQAQGPRLWDGTRRQSREVRDARGHPPRGHPLAVTPSSSFSTPCGALGPPRPTCPEPPPLCPLARAAGGPNHEPTLKRSCFPPWARSPGAEEAEKAGPEPQTAPIPPTAR